MTSEAELKEIRSLLLKLNKKVDGLNELVEKRLMVVKSPRMRMLKREKNMKLQRKMES